MFDSLFKEVMIFIDEILNDRDKHIAKEKKNTFLGDWKDQRGKRVVKDWAGDGNQSNHKKIWGNNW